MMRTILRGQQGCVSGAGASVILCVVMAMSCGVVEESAPDDVMTLTGDRQALFVTEQHMGLRGEALLMGSTYSIDELSFAVRWLIPDGPFPSTPTTTRIDVKGDGSGSFTMLTELLPPPESLVLEPETNDREGLAIGYIVAFIDGNENGALDCRNPGNCDDIFVGASPNTLVLYGDPDTLDDFSPIFDYGNGGVTPGKGWSLVHLVPNACEARPTARDWTSADSIEVHVIGNFLDKQRCEVRAIFPDVN